MSDIGHASLARGLDSTGIWPLERSSDLFELRYGKALVESSRVAGGIPVYGTNGQTGWHNEAMFDGPGIIVGRKGMGNLGVKWADRDYWVIDTAYSLQPRSGVDLKFAYYLVNHVGVNHLKHGTSNPSLTREAFGAQYFPVPPLAEQQSIAEVLGALDAKIAANLALATTADLYASTVLLGSLSTDRVRLDSIARIIMGSSPKGETLNEFGDGMPFYQGVRDYGFRSPARRVFTTSPVRSADAGDILVSVRAPVGDVNVANEALCIGRGIAAVRSTTGRQATLFHQLKAERDAWEPYEAEGTVFGSINRDQLHGIQLRTVDPKLAEVVEQVLTSLESSIAATLAENDTLATTRDALLPQLMSGKLRVRDAEAMAAKAGA
ncbi:restriction endonuclease subunit S [Microbacterium thalassium]|uniref:Type I restriction enzyme S subunit n=1 Tax=Microbacterium thalassium TaxID=362649 RepID=A0A7X0FN19_9MICO|nr:restriction endonuclease subunit S [Microbacterium thalassium]MBB6389992.1 type I restriction enzyme S subunit [Microbacterium thalassium]GLK24678.1 hypothetical protein GCM10017607_19960 [Microbacterium thalassium]